MWKKGQGCYLPEENRCGLFPSFGYSSNCKGQGKEDWFLSSNLSPPKKRSIFSVASLSLSNYIGKPCKLNL